MKFDAERKTVIMEFESNNFYLEGKHRDEGWVDENAEPNWLEKLFGKK